MRKAQLALQILRDEGAGSFVARVARRLAKRLRYAAFKIRRRAGLVKRGGSPVSVIAASMHPDEVAVAERLWQLAECGPLGVVLPDYLHAPLVDLARHGGQPRLQPISYSEAERHGYSQPHNLIVLQRGLLHRVPPQRLELVLKQWTGIYARGEFVVLTDAPGAITGPAATHVISLMRQSAADLAALKAGNLLRQAPFGATFRCHYSAADVGIINEVAAEYLGWAGVRPGPDDVIVDLGANIGAFAVACGMRNSAGTVFAFEPCRDNFELLVENIQRNCPGKVQAFHMAVHRDTAPRRLYLDSENSGGHSLSVKRWSRGVDTVECIDLEGILRLVGRSIDVLKVDVEGSEYDILFPAAELVRNHVRSLVVEAHCHGRRNGSDLVRFLEDLGFAVRTKGHPNLMLLEAHLPDAAGRPANAALSSAA